MEEACRRKRQTLQRKAVSNDERSEVPPIVHEVLRSPGQPLDKETRAFFEPRFGHDFSRVRVHTGAKAAESARTVNALAYTLGRDVVFGTGQYAPGTGDGRSLLAHELTHVIQQGCRTNELSSITAINLIDSPLEQEADRFVDAAMQLVYPHVEEPIKLQHSAAPALSRRRAPNVAARNYHSFYIRAMLPSTGNRTEVRVQFHQDPANASNATFAVWYRETNTLQQVSFNPGATIRPVILDENVGIVTFDLNGDEVPEIILTALPNNQTFGIDFLATLNSRPFFSMSAAPNRRPPYVSGRGYYFGQLPDGRPYYLVPGGPLPGGPRFVDDNNNLVDPALEAQGAAIAQAFNTVLAGWAVLVLLMGGTYLIAAAGTSATGVTVLRFLFTGPRLVSGATSAAANLVTQAIQYGTEFERYNWPSVGFDYVIGAVSNEVAHALFARWPAAIFTRAREWGTWMNFGRQQIIFLLYGTVVGLLRAQIANTRSGSTITAQHVEGVAQAAKSGAMQSFLVSAFGRTEFPSGLRDPRIIFISKLLDFVIKLAVREVFDVTPARQQNQPRQQPSR